MKTKTGLSLGLALTLMVGVFATMLALGLFTTTEAQAQVVPAATVGNVSITHSPTTRGMAAEVTVKFTPGTIVPTAGGGDKITIAYGAVAQVNGVSQPQVDVPDTLSSDADGAAATQLVTVNSSPVDAAGSGAVDAAQEIRITSLAADLPANEEVIVVIKVEAGILNPDGPGSFTVTVEAQDNTTVADPVTNTAMLAEPATVQALKVTHLPEGVGSPAKITLEFTLESGLRAGRDSIEIKFEDDVQVPTRLDADEVTISANRVVNNGSVSIGLDDTGALPTGSGEMIDSTANPAGVVVQFTGSPADDPVITLDIGDMDPSTDAAGFQGIHQSATVTVVFRQTSGIENPLEAGKRKTKVSASGNGEAEFTTVPPEDGGPFGRVVELSGGSGTRGGNVTVNGQGFRKSTTAVVWVETLGDTAGNGLGTKESTETELCSTDVQKDGTFSCSFVVNASNFTPNENRVINAKDGRDQGATKTANWKLLGKVTVSPDNAAIGDKVNVNFVDYPPGDLGTFRLGGVSLLKEDYADADEVPSFAVDAFSPSTTATREITIPDTVALGKQSLDAGIGTSSPRRFTMNILGAQVLVEPSTAVPNQTVTVTGRGFSPGTLNKATDTSQMLIGSQEIDSKAINGGREVTVDAGGSWVASVVIPIKSPSTEPGTYEFKVIDAEGRPGVTNITIPARTVTFDPPESQVGSTVTVTGTGWVATNNAGGNSDIDLVYTSANGNSTARANPNANGNFTTTIQVPRNAPIPSTNTVTVSYPVPEEPNVSETFSHRVPGAGVTISPTSGPGGTLATLTGAGFKAFTSLTSVDVGDTRVTTSPASVDRQGVLPAVTVLIPALDPGTLAIKVDVAGSIASTAFTITADDALPPPTADTTPALAFKELIDSGNLLTVYSFDEENQVYLSYDPDPANAGFNDLDMVSGGEAYWVRLTADTTFLGKTRYAEWSLVVLP